MDKMPKCPRCGGVKLRFYTCLVREHTGETFEDKGTSCDECGGEFTEDQLDWPEEESCPNS